VSLQLDSLHSVVDLPISLWVLCIDPITLLLSSTFN